MHQPILPATPLKRTGVALPGAADAPGSFFDAHPWPAHHAADIPPTEISPEKGCLGGKDKLRSGLLPQRCIVCARYGQPAPYLAEKIITQSDGFRVCVHFRRIHSVDGAVPNSTVESLASNEKAESHAVASSSVQGRTECAVTHRSAPLEQHGALSYEGAA